MKFVRLCAADEIPEGEMRRFDPPEHPGIAIYHVNGVYYATQDFCTHGESSLTDEGELEGHEIVCGRHMGRFDVRTGNVIAFPCHIPLKTFPVRNENGEIAVGLPDSQAAAG